MDECSELVSSARFNSRSLGNPSGALQHCFTGTLSSNSCQIWRLGCLLRLSRKLSSNVKLTTDQTQTNVQETLKLAKMIEENSKRTVVNTEQIIPQFQQISQIFAGSLKNTDSMIREVQQMKDQSAIAFQQTSTSIPKLDHIDQVSKQILSDTALILQRLQQLSSRFSQGGTSARVGYAGAEKTLDGLNQLSLELENTVQSHVSNENTQAMIMSTHKIGRPTIF